MPSAATILPSRSHPHPTRPAIHRLPDGRNAHLIVESADWWRAQLERRFELLMMKPAGPAEIVFLVQRRSASP
ncbi:MAG: hypothetical protein JSV80_16585 [Acidobacteriota bacterium]|nr:MAG: hypothetical protein JSV80_16585 [Acidobacteriota bacterium]